MLSVNMPSRTGPAFEERGSALLVVDAQNDFCTGGALAVPGSEAVIDALNVHIRNAAARGATIYASRDWHPPETSHFAQFGGRWPVHCVRDTPGAQFHPRLQLPADAIVVTTGDSPEADGYSAFEGRTPGGMPFDLDLRRRGVTHLVVGGIATDYCVRHSVLDALAAGLQVTVLEDAVAGVDPADSARALEEMRQRGAVIVNAAESGD